MDEEIRNLQCELLDTKIKFQSSVREFEAKLSEDVQVAQRTEVLIAERKMKEIQDENIRLRATISELQESIGENR